MLASAITKTTLREVGRYGCAMHGTWRGCPIVYVISLTFKLSIYNFAKETDSKASERSLETSVINYFNK